MHCFSSSRFIVICSHFLAHHRYKKHWYEVESAAVEPFVGFPETRILHLVWLHQILVPLPLPDSHVMNSCLVMNHSTNSHPRRAARAASDLGQVLLLSGSSWELKEGAVVSASAPRMLAVITSARALCRW